VPPVHPTPADPPPARRASISQTEASRRCSSYVITIAITESTEEHKEMQDALMQSGFSNREAQLANLKSQFSNLKFEI
jgi:hypothetical protein